MMYRIYVNDDALGIVHTDSGHVMTKSYKTLNDAVNEMTYRLTIAFRANKEQKTMLTFKIVKDR